MSLVSKAEVALINSLQKSRSSFKLPAGTRVPKSSDASQPVDAPPPIPAALSEEAEEMRNILTLEVPRFDKTKTFESLVKQKVAKKNRHMNTLDEYSQFLDHLSEEIEQKVLALSRDIRGQLEAFDEVLQQWYQRLVDDAFLVAKSEGEVGGLRRDIEAVLAERRAALDSFAASLEGLEVGRATTVSEEIKRLLDKLIAIAFQLPNEIEYTIETEAFELNAVVTSNRKTHAALLGIMRGTQVEVEVEAVHRWEVSKRRWRVLRHEQALAQYHTHMKSDLFTDPADRQRFLADFRAAQLSRHAERSAELGKLAALSADNISAEAVSAVQENLGALTDQESICMQQCYDGLTSLRSGLRYSAEARREALRLELHSYGALHDEPPLAAFADEMKAALADESLSELWRLGGGLKPEFQALSADMTTSQIVYDAHMLQIKSRLETIVSSFGLKEILNERGRLMRLDPVRGMITKMKSVPRKDVLGVLRDLMPDLEEIAAVDKVPAAFRAVVEECMADMQREMARVEEFLATLGDDATVSSRTGASRGGTAKSLKSTASAVRNASTATRGSSSRLGGASRAGSKSRAGSGTMGSGSTVDYEYEKNSTIDPLSVKHWARQLGILYYGSNLPENYQGTCVKALEGASQQLECNAKVDKVVSLECRAVMDRIDIKYKKLIDQIATYLETQVATLNTSCTNLAELYMNLARATEVHRAAQIEIDETAADALFDYSEDYRLQREDLEAAYEEACRTLRRSADYDTLAESFEAVLKCLLDIQNSYRLYHEKACFLADMHPLDLANEFKGHLEKICQTFDLSPVPPHPILHNQKRILKTVKRLNKKYYKDPSKAHDPESAPAADSDSPAGDSDSPAADSDSPAGVASAPPSQDDDDKDEQDKAPTEDPEFPGGLYVSPLFENPEEIITNGAVIGSSSTKIGGKYGLNTPMPDYVACLFEDPQVIEDRKRRMDEIRQEEEAERLAIEKANNATESPAAEPAPVSPRADPPAKKGKGPSAAEIAAQKAAEEAAAAEKLARERSRLAVMEAYPWMLAAGAEALGGRPFPPDSEWEAMDGPDREEREDLIAQYMIHLKGGAQHPAVAADPDGLGALYARCVEARTRSAERRRYASDPDFILKNIPSDARGRPWLERIEVFQDGVVKVLTNVRNSLVTHLENEAYYKTVTMEELNKTRKAVLTEELEDRLRTHWPRRGRVETQLKQPREAELLAHQEKTWRIVQSVQEKMLDLLNRFEESLAAGQEGIDQYVEEMKRHKETLETTSYKTLASLQGMDVKGRSAFLSFQSECGEHLSRLRGITDGGIEAIVENAQDFRKLCPLQKMGKDGVPSGGYSEAEISHIQSLVDGQEQEIRELAEEWRERVAALEAAQTEAMGAQEEYTALYGKVAQDLALSEGLGQRYGAPRRRAQERLRTEVSRDEQAAGKIDEMLAKLQFALSENSRKYEELASGAQPETDGEPPPLEGSNGREEYDEINYVWGIVQMARCALDARAKYLQVYPDNRGPDMAAIAWIPPEAIPAAPAAGRETDGATASAVPSVEAMNFAAVVAEAEADCKKETVQLYESENRGDMIKSLPGGVPESLTAWLEETRARLLGRGGHREKAWKRLWRQADALDGLLARKPGPLESPEPRLGLPGMSMKGIRIAFAQYLLSERTSKESVFAKTVSVLEKCRDKHDRLLRPRLGSPDAVHELDGLNSTEEQRSKDLTDVVVRFRSSLVKRLASMAKEFVDIVAVASTSYMSVLDNTVRLDVLEIPPDTEVPKKRMTLKKLRKAERIKDAVATGAEDSSKSRVWSGIDGSSIVRVLRSVDDLILEGDRDQPAAAAAPAAAAPPPKGKLGKTASSVEAAAVSEEMNPTSLVTDSWVRAIGEKSAKRGLVSSAHRLLLSERDAAVECYFSSLEEMFREIRLKYDATLQRESSWSQRWKRQVELLRNGVS